MGHGEYQEENLLEDEETVTDFFIYAIEYNHEVDVKRI